MCRMFGFVAFATFCLVGSLGFAQEQATFYVAPTGNDANPGTEAAPFKTITKAQPMEISAMLRERPARNCGVYKSDVSFSDSLIYTSILSDMFLATVNDSPPPIRGSVSYSYWRSR